MPLGSLEVFRSGLGLNARHDLERVRFGALHFWLLGTVANTLRQNNQLHCIWLVSGLNSRSGQDDISLDSLRRAVNLSTQEACCNEAFTPSLWFQVVFSFEGL